MDFHSFMKPFAYGILYVAFVGVVAYIWVLFQKRFTGEDLQKRRNFPEIKRSQYMICKDLVRGSVLLSTILDKKADRDLNVHERWEVLRYNYPDISREFYRPHSKYGLYYAARIFNGKHKDMKESSVHSFLDIYLVPRKLLNVSVIVRY